MHLIWVCKHPYFEFEHKEKTYSVKVDHSTKTPEINPCRSFWGVLAAILGGGLVPLALLGWNFTLFLFTLGDIA